MREILCEDVLSHHILRPPEGCSSAVIFFPYSYCGPAASNSFRRAGTAMDTAWSYLLTLQDVPDRSPSASTTVLLSNPVSQPNRDAEERVCLRLAGK